MAEFEYIEDQNTEVQQQPKQDGELNILGNIFNRPGAAIRSGIKGLIDPNKSFLDEYTRGANQPKKVTSFQSDFIKSTQKSTSPAMNAVLGMPASAVGLMADIATNPGDILLSMVGGAAISKLKGAQIGKVVGDFFHQDLDVHKIVDPVLKRIPRVMNDNWVYQQARNGQKVASQLDDALGNSFNTIYEKVGNMAVDPKKIEKILSGSNIDDAVRADIDKFFGTGAIDTIEKAKTVADILRKRTPQSFYLSGGTRGKGGLTNTKITQINVSRAIKDVMHDAIGAVDPEAGKTLKALNSFAHKSVYPKLGKLEGMFGRGDEPRSAFINDFRLTNIGAATERGAVKSVPKLTKELKKYISSDYVEDLKDLTSNSKQLIKDLGKFRSRQAIKWGVAATSAVIGGNQLLRKFTGGG